MFSAKFWRETAERAIKTAAQAPLSVWFVGDGVMNAFDMDWQLGLGVALGGAIFSVLTSIATAKIGAANTPSVV